MKPIEIPVATRLFPRRVGQGRGEAKSIYLSIKNPGTTADARDRRPTSGAGISFGLTRAANCASVVGRCGAGLSCSPDLICCQPPVRLDAVLWFTAQLVPPYDLDCPNWQWSLL